MTTITDRRPSAPIEANKANGGDCVSHLVVGSSERLALEILRADMRITDARLSDAIDHEEGLRALHDAAKDRVALLRSIKRDLQARVDSIFSANAATHTPGASEKPLK